VPEAPELPDLRELLVDNYRVVYRRQAERVDIVLVIHGRRDLAGMEPKPWQR
jgi:plasmid stabilization system protein ParE